MTRSTCRKWVERHVQEIGPANPHANKGKKFLLTTLMTADDNDDSLPHPLDLPTLSSKPSYSDLFLLLDKITPPPPSWNEPIPRSKYNYTSWLTRLIASPMTWLSPSEAETISSMASNNLVLRAGRTALSDITRTFTVAEHEISLFEPSWTGDALGHKTWGASLLLARRLHSLHLVSDSRYLSPKSACKCLGLGEGTGLLGIAAAKAMSWRLTLTDLPIITMNLQRNVLYNCGESVDVKALDWLDPPDDIPQNSFEVIIASDLFYDPHHPRMVVAMLERYLKKDPEARVVLEFPLRPSHTAEVSDFGKRMDISFVLEASGEETGRDDWDTDIECRWVIYRWK